MIDINRLHVMVEGRVQGVYYRASTEQQAQGIGITGWVRNLPNGKVEFEAQGTEVQLSAILKWAEQGPQNAHVTKLTKVNIPTQAEEKHFSIRY